LKKIYLRNTSTITKCDFTSFNGSLFDTYSGTGIKPYIYVPASLLEAYKNDGIWSPYAKFIVSIENEDNEEFDSLTTFSIDGIQYSVIDGMTWADWCNSEYNTAGFYIKDTSSFVSDINGKNVCATDGHEVLSTKNIYSGDIYHLVEADDREPV
jgi:hypothetical protein